MAGKKILFVFHEARLSGASLALLRVVQWLKPRSDFSFSFLLLQGGELESSISELGNILEWRKKDQGRSRLTKKIKRTFGDKSKEEILMDLVESGGFDLIYFNTLLCSDLIAKLNHLPAKKLWHIHELELAVNSLGEGLLNSHSYVDYVIANSRSTKDYLISQGVVASKTEVFNPIVNLAKINDLAKVENTEAAMLSNEQSFIIGSSGTVMERKGVQSFLIVASIMVKKHPSFKFKFIWVGSMDASQKAIIQYDIKKLGLSEQVFFLGEKSNPFPYYAAMDLFISTSKEESFGLSVVEAACLKRPILCFENTGGVQEIMEHNKESMVPYMDVEQLADKILEVANDKEKLNEWGEKASRDVAKYDEEMVMPDVLDFLQLILH